MEREHRPYQQDLTSIHINLEDHAIEFEGRYGTVGRLLFTGETVLYEGQPLFLAPTGDPHAPSELPLPPLPDPPRDPQRSPRLSRNSSPQNPRLPF